MSEGFSEAGPPGIELNRLAKVITFEVMDNDLEALENAYARENSAFGWFSAQLSIFATLLTTTAASWSTLGSSLLSVFIALTVAFGVIAVRSWRLWVVAKAEAPRIVKRIRTSYRVVQ